MLRRKCFLTIQAKITNLQRLKSDEKIYRNLSAGSK